MTTDPKTYYRVAVTDGWLTDDQGRYLRECITLDCGHNHRTEEAAEACRQKLLNWDREHRNCSAKWYNSRVLPTDREGQHIRQLTREEDFPGYCLECGVAVEGETGGTLCPKCAPQYERC
jgi:hypothetical protein